MGVGSVGGSMEGRGELSVELSVEGRGELSWGGRLCGGIMVLKIAEFAYL